MCIDYFEKIVHNYNKISILVPNNFCLMLVLVIPQFHQNLRLFFHIIPGCFIKIIFK